MPPGSFVIPDQLVDRTYGRLPTFVEEDGIPHLKNFVDRGGTSHGGVQHLAFAEPYDASLREILLKASNTAGSQAFDGGTVVVIPGPRFSTKAESKFYVDQGWDLINMTQAPEAALAVPTRCTVHAFL